MRWEALFADLAAEFDAEAEAERRSEVSDRIRSEFGRLRLIDRLQPLLRAGSRPVRLGLAGHEAITGVVGRLGADWLLLTAEAGGGGGEVVVPLTAVRWIQGLGQDSAAPGWEGVVGARLSLRIVLRRLARDRLMVAVALTSGEVLRGRIARVGADFVELDGEREAADILDSAAAAGATIPQAAIAFVRRR